MAGTLDRDSGLTVVLVPGWNGSGPEHWQSLWHRGHPEYHWVEQADWARPEPAAWIAGIDRAVRDAKNVMFVAHSLGCHAVVLWAAASSLGAKAEGALLVAPPDLSEEANPPDALRCFGHATHRRVPFPSILVGSENDTYMTLESAQRLARQWGSRFVNAGVVGHLNSDSGHGPWPLGESLMESVAKPS